MQKNKRFWLNIFALILAFVFAIGLLIKNKINEDEANLDETIRLKSEFSSSISNSSANTSSTSAATSETKFPVYITGAVKKPGIYKVKPGTYLYELIDMAGGFSAEAAEDKLNLAGKIKPESHLIVYTETEYEKLLEAGRVNNDLYLVNTDTEDDETSGSSKKLININLATKEQLMTLPGIGESYAERIIAYRQEHGQFNAIEDIMLVSGIKTAKFEKIKDLIKV